MIKESSVRVEIVHTQCQCEDPNEGFQPYKNERSDERYILAPVHVLAMDASSHGEEVLQRFCILAYTFKRPRNGM